MHSLYIYIYIHIYIYIYIYIYYRYNIIYNISEDIAVGTATLRRTTMVARWQSLEHRCRSLTTSVRAAYKSTRICRLMSKSMQFADRVTITPELCYRSLIICRSILLRQWLVPSSVHVLTTVTRSFTTSQRRTFKSYRGYKTISHV